MAELVCGTADRDAWLAARREGITATDLPVILGLVTWDSPFALYWRKKGVLPEVEASDRMRLGSWLEDAIAGEWLCRQSAVTSMRPGGLYRSAARPWQMATPDKIVLNMVRKPVAVLECKASATCDGWGHGIGGRHECGTLTCEENSKVPAYVRAQVLWQMDTLDVAVGYVAVVFLPSGEFRSYTISHQNHDGGCMEAEQLPDCAACRDQWFLRGAGQGFKSLLDSDTPPPVDGLQVTTDALRFLHAGAVKGKTAEIPTLISSAYHGFSLELDRAKEGKRRAENEIRALMGDATLAVDVDGQVFARREVFKRAGYEVPPCEVDRLVRVKPKEDKTDG